jgi:hypothetical protein
VHVPGCSELEGGQISGHLHGSSEGRFGFGRQLPGVGESLLAEVGENEAIDPGRPGDLARRAR